MQCKTGEADISYSPHRYDLSRCTPAATKILRPRERNNGSVRIGGGTFSILVDNYASTVSNCRSSVRHPQGPSPVRVIIDLQPSLALLSFSKKGPIKHHTNPHTSNSHFTQRNSFLSTSRLLFADTRKMRHLRV